MRLLTLVTLSASSLALSGCSFLGGNTSQGQHHRAANSYANSSANSNCCGADRKISRFNVEAALGGEFIVGGNAFETDDDYTPFAGQTLEELSMSEIYAPASRAELGVSYALSPSRKITGQVSFTHAEGKQVNIGERNAIEMTGQFSDYQSLGLEAGMRQYFKPRFAGKSLGYRPYIEGKLGAQKTEDMDLRFRETGGGWLETDFYKGGWVPTAAAMIGVETPMFKRGTLGLETGVRYSGALDGAEDADVNQRVRGANKGSEILSIPLTIRGRYRF